MLRLSEWDIFYFSQDPGSVVVEISTPKSNAIVIEDDLKVLLYILLSLALQLHDMHWVENSAKLNLSWNLGAVPKYSPSSRLESVFQAT